MDGDPRSGLLERERELGAIRRLCATAGAGTGGAILLEGPAGIGKSRLLAAARAEAETYGLRVLSARASELESGFGFGIVRQLLEPALAAASNEERTTLLSGAAALAEPVLTGAGPALEDADATPAALHGLYWLTAELAGRGPLLLCIDDLQWADEPSVRWLIYLLGRLDGIAAGVLAAARAEEGGGSPELRDALHIHPAVDTLAPAALSARGVANVVAARLGMPPEEEFVAACRRATGGNPFLLSELVDELAATGVLPIAATAGEVHEIGPRAVRRSVLARLRRLGPAPAALARAIAVLGEGVELGAAAAYAELDPAAAAAAADALASAHIAEPGRPLAFVHPIVLAAVRSELGQGELGEAHARAARQLREAGAPASRIALHLLNAEPSGDDQAVADLRAAATEARGRGAPELAARLLRRALRERPSPDVESELLLELGTAELSAEQLQRSIDHLGRAAELSANPRSRARATLPLAVAVLRTERAPEALGLLEQAAQELVGVDEDLREVVQSTRLIAAGAAPQAFAHYRETGLASAEWTNGRIPRTLGERLAAGRAAFEQALVGSAPGALELARLAWGQGEALHALGPAQPAVYLPASASLWADELDAAIRRLTEILDESRRRGSVSGFVDASHFRAIAWWRRGALLEVEADARNALDQGAPYAIPIGAVALADVLIERGQPAAAEALLGNGPDAPPGLVTSFALEVSARLRVTQRRPDDALELLFESGKLEAAFGFTSPSSCWRSAAAPLLHAAGEEARARNLAGEGLARARAYESPRGIGIALRAAALVGPPGQRCAGLEESVAVLRESGARLELARSLVELGVAARRERRPADARAPLREGAELALRCGATMLAEQAAHELGAAGDQPRRAGPERRDELTAAELRVARMAAEGMTNREIAQALFLTEKTIEHHLSSVYRKLEIRSRVQLVRALPDAEPMAA
jgi:DNA-binding CsgD family transcriptional regulator/tetratricopeptide (TPR) repeat protein